MYSRYFNITMVILSIIMIISSLLKYVVGDGTMPAWIVTVWAFNTLLANFTIIRFK